MPLSVIDQLEVLVLIDNKTDSLSSIPHLVSGKAPWHLSSGSKYLLVILNNIGKMWTRK